MSDFKRRKEKYLKFFEDTTEYHALDVRCQHLLLVFFITFERTKEIGFGALFRELGKWSELKMSRSMLSEHLKHLEKKGIISSRQLKESRRRIADKRYRLTPLLVGSAEGFLRIENDQFRANLIAEASKGVDDHALVATVFRIFATYGLEALHYIISLTIPGILLMHVVQFTVPLIQS